MKRIGPILIGAGVVSAQPAYAHLGHVGDLAGHSHWIGLGALVVAGAIAVAVGKLGSEQSNEADEAEHEPEEEAA